MSRKIELGRLCIKTFNGHYYSGEERCMRKIYARFLPCSDRSDQAINLQNPWYHGKSLNDPDVLSQFSRKYR